MVVAAWRGIAGLGSSFRKMSPETEVGVGQWPVPPVTCVEPGVVADWPQGDHSSGKLGVPLAPGWQTGSVTDSSSRVATAVVKLGCPQLLGLILCQLHALISHTSKLCSKSFKLEISSMWAVCDLPDVQAGFRKGRGTRHQMPTNARSEKTRQFKKKKKCASLTKLKPLTVWVTTNWKILKEMGIPDHLTCLQRNLYAGEETTVRTRHETNRFRIGKGVHQGCILSPCFI